MDCPSSGKWKEMTRLIIILSLLVLTVFSAQDAFSQRWKRTRYEVFGGIGPSTFFGDLGGSDKKATHFGGDLDLSSTRYCFMLGARYKIMEKLAVKLNLSYSRVAGSDAYTNEEQRSKRGIEFKSYIFEHSAQIEYSILKERFGTRYTFRNLRRFSFRYVNTYVFVGVGGFMFNPKINIIGQTNKNESFSKYNATFPIGVGFKYGIDRRWCFGVEFGQRYTTTDYLDGHADKWSKARDSYGFLIFNVTYKLKTARSGLPKF